MSSPLSDNPNLRPCPACGSAVSVRAQSCPHCGDPLKNEETENAPATPSSAPPAPDEETVYYQDGQVTVSATRLVVGEKTYAMINLTSVAMIQQTNSAVGCLGCIGLVGVSMALGGLGTMGQDAVGGALSLLLGVVMTIIAIGAFTHAKPDWVVRVSSASGEAQALTSPDKDRVEKIVEAVKRAIVNRG